MHQSAAIVGNALPILAGALADELHVGPRQLRVRRDTHQELLVQRHRSIGLGRGGRARRQRLEHRPDSLLDLLRIDIADHDDGHAIGAVPCVVERAQPRGGRVAEDVGLADRQPLGVPRSIEEHGELLVADTRPGAQAAAPLLDDHAPFLVDFGGVERQPAGEIGHRRQPFRHDFGLVARQLEHVDGLVEAGVGVDVRSEPGADRLERRDQLAGLEVRAAIERHVLDEVRETLLVVGLVNRPRLDGQPQRDPFGRLCVLADEHLARRS